MSSQSYPKENDCRDTEDDDRAIDSASDTSSNYAHSSDSKHEADDKADIQHEDNLFPPSKSKGFKLNAVARKVITVNRMAWSAQQRRRMNVIPNAERFKNQFIVSTGQKEERGIDDSTLRFRFAIVFCFLVLLTAAGVVAPLIVEMSLYYISYAAIAGFIFLFFLCLDYCDNFGRFQRCFEAQCHSHSQSVFLFSFCITAFVDYVLMGLEEDGVITGEAVIIVIDVLYYLALVLFFCAWMAYWKTFSFYCSEKSSLHALFYLTIVGYAVIRICRWMRPPSATRKSWHFQHKTAAILSAIQKVVLFLFVFCVVLGGLGIAAFSEFARQSATYGVGVAIAGFCAVSMLIMLTPLAPGSIVDACGGFVFVQLLAEKHDFFIAWGVALGAVCVLHFVGACVQWWMGTWPCIQGWANKSLPIEMLAASDAVLRDAGVIKVGLVGYIFMDTANGLNQGRINMAFWTQLLSEWTSIPNALGLVSLGATIAAQALELPNMEWTIIAVPLFILFSTLITTAGASFGARAMGDSTDTAKYWTSREKWTMFQFFSSEGYSPTIKGWTNDCFELAQLYDKVAPLHFAYLTARRKASKDQMQKIKVFEEYRAQLTKAREEHYEHFEAERKEQCLERGWLVFEPPKHPRPGFFALRDDELELPSWKVSLWAALITVATVAFWGAFYGVYMQSSLTSAVQLGIATLENVTSLAWAACAVFVTIVLFIFHVEIANSTKSMASTLKWMCTGCSVNKEIETKFFALKYQVPPQFQT